MDWVSRGSGTPSPQSATICNYYNRLHSNSTFGVENRNKSSSATRILGGDKVSYWTSNSRHNLLETDHPTNVENESDWPRHSRVCF